MTTRLITQPAALAVSLEDAREAARADGTELDAQLTIAIQGITKDAEHITGRSFINQTWRVTLDRFPDAIRLDHPPIVSVASVKYYDADGVQQTLDPQDYTVDAVSEPGYIVPAAGKAWPTTAERINAVEVQYTAGYGADHTATPHEVKLYILAKVSEQFSSGAKESPYVERLLDGVKIWAL